MKNNQQGQVILILLLIMTVALAIGLSVVQRSLTDVSTASKLEQSSRAFSAAEAGIEQILQTTDPSVITNLTENNASASANRSNIPSDPQTSQQEALEYPPVTRDEIANIWLANPYDATLAQFYNQPTLEVYWGKIPVATNNQNWPAIEIKLIYVDSSSVYRSRLFYADPAPSGDRANNFTRPDDTVVFNSGSGCNPAGLTAVETTSSPPNKIFYCKVILKNLNTSSLPGGLSKLVLIRLRLLYTSDSEPVAIRGVGTCGQDCALPRQAQIYKSIGSSGETQRTIQLFREDKVVPAYFDYAIFAEGVIQKIPN